jgi:hypothetical protein
MAVDQPALKSSYTVEEMQQIWDAQGQPEDQTGQPASSQPAPIQEVPFSEEPKKKGKDWETRYQVASEHIKNVEAENSLLRAQQQQVSQTIQQLQGRLDQLEKTKHAPAAPAVDQSAIKAERSKEHEEFLKDFPVINEVIGHEARSAIQLELANLLPKFMDEVRAEFGVLLKERSAYQRALNAQKRHQLADQRLGISNALAIDNSPEWGKWVSASPQRLKIAQAGVMEGHENYEQAADDFVALMREYIQHHPDAADPATAEGTVTPALHLSRPRTSAPVRTPNAAAPRSRAKPKLDSSSTMAELQAYWNSLPQKEQPASGAW